MTPFCTFIIPTINRETLPLSLDSLVRQTDRSWSALVVGDGLGKEWCPPWTDERISFMNTPEKRGTSNHAGLVRNAAIPMVSGEWTAFLDDDDRLDEHYVQWLREESLGMDVVIFRMKMSDGSILPPSRELVCGLVGISFAILTSFREEKWIEFVPGDVEDWIFLNSAINAGARHRLSDRACYYPSY